MENYQSIGQNYHRKDAYDKVCGIVKFTADYTVPGLLYAKLLTSPFAHAKINSIDITEALKLPGVKAVLTGEHYPFLTGSLLKDRPVMAVKKVRYMGEPIAIVVAESELIASEAVKVIHVDYEMLPVVNSVADALKEGATLIHEHLSSYTRVKEANFKPMTNIANHVKIRKGNMDKGWKSSEIIVEETFSYPRCDHAALETRCVRSSIFPDGQVNIYSTSQSPFVIKKLIHRYFNVDPGKIIVHTPFVGGSFGGKAAVQMEFLAFMASKAVGGKEVKLELSREEDMLSAPGHIGLEAKVKFGCTKEGILQAAEITFLFDTGAYSDQGLAMTKAAAANCTGPYNIENVFCDSYCVYTNHPYATSFRGFGHSEFTFAIERLMDILAKKLNMDPLEFRLKNTIRPKNTTPTQTVLNDNNIGDLSKCILRLKELLKENEGKRLEVNSRKVRATGVAVFWKSPTSPPNATSSAIVTFNHDGSVNLNIGAVELGQGVKTILAQILAERLKVEINQVNVTNEVNTQTNPEHWKTVASTATFMVGNAVIEAADDAINQIREIASILLRCSPAELDVAKGKVFLERNPNVYVDVKDVASGLKYSNGNAIGGHVIGSGTYIMRNLTLLDLNTGKGTVAPTWTVGAQAVEVEFDTSDYSYQIVRAYSVMDAGKVINYKTAQGVTMGGMCMGLGIASREGFSFSESGIVENPNLRSYKLMRFGDAPEYLVDFVETPQTDGPFGARGLGEHGVIGMPAALANSLSIAAEVELNHLPLLPETIWKEKNKVGES